MVHRIPAASWDTVVLVALAPSHPFVLIDLGARSCTLHTAGDPGEFCGCDLCDAAFDDLDVFHDAGRVAFLGTTDLAPMPWELRWTPDLALVASDTLDADETK